MLRRWWARIVEEVVYMFARKARRIWDNFITTQLINSTSAYTLHYLSNFRISFRLIYRRLLHLNYIHQHVNSPEWPQTTTTPPTPKPPLTLTHQSNTTPTSHPTTPPKQPHPTNRTASPPAIRTPRTPTPSILHHKPPTPPQTVASSPPPRPNSKNRNPTVR